MQRLQRFGAGVALSPPYPQGEDYQRGVLERGRFRDEQYRRGLEFQRQRLDWERRNGYR
jgi:hypothetical protein